MRNHYVYGVSLELGIFVIPRGDDRKRATAAFFGFNDEIVDVFQQISAHGFQVFCNTRYVWKQLRDFFQLRFYSPLCH